MQQWARQLASGDPRFHAVAAVVFGGDVMARCRAHWPERDAVEEMDAPPVGERCDSCEAALVDAGLIERGLKELLQATEAAS